MNEMKNHNNAWRRLKIFVGLVVMAFAVTSAVVISDRLSDEALAVLAGAVCGVGAAIPTSLLIVAAGHRRGASAAGHVSGAYPPVMVAAPDEPQRLDERSHCLPLLVKPAQRVQ